MNQIISLSAEEPGTYREAASSPRWKKSMEEEMQSLQNNEVWELVEPPLGRKVVGCKWVYKIKRDGDGRIERYKARLVATLGADYDETFSPVVRMESLRMLIGLAARLKLHQLDVTTQWAEEEQPNGFIAEGQEKLVCKLKRSIYGLKQSPRCWNATLDTYMKEIGFLQSTGDPCIYIAALGEVAVVGVYVDDIVVACKSDERCQT